MQYFECSICGGVHPFNYEGDCRDDVMRLEIDDLEEGDELYDEQEYNEYLKEV